MATLSNAEKRFLKELVTSVKRPLNLAWLFTIINTLLFVYQAWLLASLFSTWLNNYFNELPLATNVNNYWLAALTVCFILRPLLNSGRELISSRASFKVRSDLRESLLSIMAKLGPNLRYFGSDGSLSSQIIDQTDALDGFIRSFSVQRKVAASTPIILLTAVAWQSWVAAALLLLTAPLVPIFMILIGHLTASKSADQFTALAQLSGRFLDWVRGMPTLKRLQATEIAGHDLAISSEDYRRRTMDVLKIAFLNGAILELLAALSIALVAVYLGFGLIGILPWDKGHVPVPYFGALFILLLAPEFYLPLRQLGADYHAKAEAEGAIQSLLPIIEAAKPVSTTDINGNNHQFDPNINTTGSTSLDVYQAFGIKLSNLNIRSQIITSTKLDNQLPPDSTSDTQSSRQPIYRTRLAPTTFDIKAGERVALIGDSGSGKSSLLQALMGFVSYEGDITFMNANSTEQVPYHDIDPELLRQNIGYLAQQVALMPLTIAENLRLANPEATDQDLINALDVVALWPLIQRLPDGINTQLGERGQGLSGGQQQRLGIAQLLLRDDSLWLLDEPTEHLDPDTAQHIHALLETVSRNKTVLWVTHAHEQLDWLDNVIQLSLPLSANHQTLDDNEPPNQLGGAQ
ncbi:MAG: thiol reductant ABC exporter subunit CydD [Psychrobacter sp.]|uniref:thiol reductant ABC exporter subunit CydD n=1 Tax=unclassified Psychrobacter TaxID=196806 RepID=UPI001787E044|nr:MULTISPECIES: thiol reductant ABC exporter subunit CydD [unclassified Psychrobacter]MBE0441106.1 thiol reductant ABC exporter subunit CydD [Psychrobacter sp. FME13]